MWGENFFYRIEWWRGYNCHFFPKFVKSKVTFSSTKPLIVINVANFQSLICTRLAATVINKALVLRDSAGLTVFEESLIRESILMVFFYHLSYLLIL